MEGRPLDESTWEVQVRGAGRLGRALREGSAQAGLFRTLAIFRTDAPVFGAVDELQWTGPRPGFFETCARLNAPGYFKRAQALGPARVAEGGDGNRASLERV